MTAMDNATRNAGDMINKLTIQYNRSTPGCDHHRADRDHRRGGGAVRRMLVLAGAVAVLAACGGPDQEGRLAVATDQARADDPSATSSSRNAALNPDISRAAVTAAVRRACPELARRGSRVRRHRGADRVRLPVRDHQQWSRREAGGHHRPTRRRVGAARRDDDLSGHVTGRQSQLKSACIPA